MFHRALTLALARRAWSLLRCWNLPGSRSVRSPPCSQQRSLIFRRHTALRRSVQSLARLSCLQTGSHQGYSRRFQLGWAEGCTGAARHTKSPDGTLMAFPAIDPTITFDIQSEMFNCFLFEVEITYNKGWIHLATLRENRRALATEKEDRLQWLACQFIRNITKQWKINLKEIRLKSNVKIKHFFFKNCLYWENLYQYFTCMSTISATGQHYLTKSCTIYSYIHIIFYIFLYFFNNWNNIF